MLHTVLLTDVKIKLYRGTPRIGIILFGRGIEKAAPTQGGNSERREIMKKSSYEGLVSYLV